MWEHKCRFDLINPEGTPLVACIEHRNSTPIICTHAAQALERHFEEAKASIAHYNQLYKELERRVEQAYKIEGENGGLRFRNRDLESRLARLQEEKAQVEGALARAVNNGLHCSAVCGTCGFAYQEHKGHIIRCPVCRLTKAEAAAGAMHEATYNAMKTIAVELHNGRWAALNASNETTVKLLEAALSRLPGGEGGKA